MTLNNTFLFYKLRISIYDNNKTIKDGGIAPWLIGNNLSTWPYRKIWTKRKEKNKEKRLNHDMGGMVERFLFLLQAFAPSALRLDVHKMYFPLFFVSLPISDIIVMISDNFLIFPDGFQTSSWPERNSKVPKSTRLYSKVLKSTQEYSNVPKNTPKVPKSTWRYKKYLKIPKRTQKF